MHSLYRLPGSTQILPDQIFTAGISRWIVFLQTCQIPAIDEIASE